MVPYGDTIWPGDLVSPSDEAACAGCQYSVFRKKATFVNYGYVYAPQFLLHLHQDGNFLSFCTSARSKYRRLIQLCFRLSVSRKAAILINYWGVMKAEEGLQGGGCIHHLFSDIIFGSVRHDLLLLRLICRTDLL